MTWIMVDVETDGPVPGIYSMISLGAVVVDEKLDRTFYAQLRPISEGFVSEALAVSGHTREECMTFPTPEIGMRDFATWIAENGGNRPMFISDNNGFDWMFVCWYFWKFTGDCPFGHSSTNLGSLYKGLVKDMKQNFKHLRRTRHSHHPVEDARGNAEALRELKKLGLGIDW